MSDKNMAHHISHYRNVFIYLLIGTALTVAASYLEFNVQRSIAGAVFVGQVNLRFKPTVPVFDANVSLGRRHNRRVAVDTAEGTLRAMDRAGIDRALVYSPHAAAYDSRDGNALKSNS